MAPGLCSLADRATRQRGPKVKSHASRACPQRAQRRARQQAAKRGRPRPATGTPYHTQNALARALVWQVARAGGSGRCIRFDHWYASLEHLRFCTRVGLAWVTRLKHNTCVRFEGRTVSGKDVASRVPTANSHASPKLGARARSLAVVRFGRSVKLPLVKDDAHPKRDRTKDLATSGRSRSHAEQVRWYRRRWPIECFFRDAKQLWGLDRSLARQHQAVLTHLRLGGASVRLQLLKPLSP